MSKPYDQQEFRMLLAAQIAPSFTEKFYNLVPEVGPMPDSKMIAKVSLEIANEIIRQGSDQGKYPIRNNITDSTRK